MATVVKYLMPTTSKIKSLHLLVQGGQVKGLGKCQYEADKIILLYVYELI